MPYRVLSTGDRKIVFDDFEMLYSDFPKPSRPYDKFEVEDAVNAIIRRDWHPGLTVHIEGLRADGEPIQVLLVYDAR